MTDGKDIAWKPYAFSIGAGLVGIAIGVFLVAPALQKREAKKLAAKKKSGDKADSSKKTT